MTEKYILENFDKTVRFRPNDEGRHIGLPEKYTVPCISGGFCEMYYWDTYFTNKGLIIAGKADLAKSNCNNVAYMINKFGYMPNGSSISFIGRSQPPFFALMVKDVFEATGDEEWLKVMLIAIEKELVFWENKRKGGELNRYYGDYDETACENFGKMVRNRIKIDEYRDLVEAGLDYIAEAESGWDFTGRFNGRCADFNAVDLNSLLYAAENFLGEHAGYENWKIKAEERKQKINEILFDEKQGVFIDYDFINDEFSTVKSCAGFMPFFVGVADEKYAFGAKNLLKAVEEEFALSATEETDNNYQWGYKNAWAPLHLITVVGLNNYGFIEDAKRVAKKYIDIVDSNFNKTGGLWEKYNAITGGIDAVSEYGTPEMMGWTAGVYLYCKKFLNQ